jgi:hypothetical protein
MPNEALKIAPSGEMTRVQPMTFATMAATDKPSATPAAAPMSESTRASLKNCSKICRGAPPIAERMPIYFVRSATETSWMFMMPMPPTRSDTAAMPCKRPPRIPEVR